MNYIFNFLYLKKYLSLEIERTEENKTAELKLLPDKIVFCKEAINIVQITNLIKLKVSSITFLEHLKERL